MKIVRQTRYVPLIIRGEEVKIKLNRVLIVLVLLLILTASCSKVFFSTHTVTKETVCVPVEVRDTVIKTVIRTKIKYVESPLSKRIVRDFTKAVPTPQVKKNTKTYCGYTPYQIMMWHLKAHESFRPYEYPDGDYNSKGFGLNLNKDHIKWAKKELGFNPKNRNWTFEEGKKLLVAYCEQKTIAPLKLQHPNLNDFQIVAYAVHKYNTGNVKKFGYCCGGKSVKMRCGRKLKAHHERRVFEVELFNGTLSQQKIEKDRQKAIDIEKNWN